MTSTTHAVEPTDVVETAVVVEALSKWYGARRTLRAAGGVGALEAADADALDDDDVGDDESDELDADEEPTSDSGWALRDVSFTAARGAGVAVLGPVGSGKSTLLKILARVSLPTSGRAVIHGRVAPLLEVASSLMQGELTGRANIVLLSRFLGIPRDVVDRRIDEVAEFAGVRAFLDTKAKRYSSGQYRRLALSAVLNLEPDVLLIDGNLAGGDVEFESRALDLIQQRKREGLAVVCATSDVDLAHSICEEAILLKLGRVVAAGGFDQVAGELKGKDRRSNESRSAGRRAKLGFNEHAALSGAVIVGSDGARVDSIRVDEEASLRLLVEVATHGTAIQCTAAFEVQGAPWLHIVQPKPFKAKPGSYVLSVTIPPGSLPENEYSLRLGAWVSADGSRDAIVRPDVLTLETFDPPEIDEAIDGIEPFDSSERRKLTDLEWTIELSRKLLP
jgi:lipopolysaccharide transport system ATP-binding protein